MSRAMKILLSLVIATALCLTAILALRYRAAGQQLLALNQELAVSRASWEGIAEEKEALQADLKTVTDNLKEARLTLEESTARAAELEEDIAVLEQEIAALKSQLHN